MEDRSQLAFPKIEKGRGPHTPSPFYLSDLYQYYPPKLSKCNISIGTPKLSNMFSTAFDIGPGPHM